MVAMKHTPAPAEPTPSAAPAVDDWIVMRDASQSLTPVRRATVVLRFYEDLEEAEIAAILDRPVGSVKSHLHRAKKQLRSLLGHQNPTLRRAAA